MKSEQEFLTEMWADIAKIEYEEQQKMGARKRHRSLVLQGILLYITLGLMFLVLVFLVLVFFSKMTFNFLLLTGGGCLVLGYILDAFTFKRLIQGGMNRED